MFLKSRTVKKDLNIRAPHTKNIYVFISVGIIWGLTRFSIEKHFLLHINDV